MLSSNLQAALKANLRHGHARGEHTKTYRAWANAKTRCYNDKTPYYKNYGGRGIVMCDEWRDNFATFLRDMGPRPVGTWLERRDNDGPYAPWNCYWATPTEQQRNSRRTKRIAHAGQALTIAEWAERTGISRAAIEKRLRIGWPVDEALTYPVEHGRPRRHRTINVSTQTGVKP